MLITIAAPILISAAAVVALNYEVFGYAGLTNILTSGEAAVMRQLMRIDGGRDGRYVPITQKARDLAAQASPRWRNWRPAIEDPFIINLSERYTGVKNGIDTQRYVVLLKRISQSTAYPGLFSPLPDFSDPRKSTAIWQKELFLIADELRLALDRGEIPGRRGFSPLIDPVVKAWLPDIPAAFVEICRLLFLSPRPWVDMQGYGLLKRESDRMTHVLNRDPFLTRKGPMRGRFTVEGEKRVKDVELFVSALIFPMFAFKENAPLEKLSSVKWRPLEDGSYEFESPVLTERWVPLTLALKISFADASSALLSNLEVGNPLPQNKNGIASYEITGFAPIISAAESASVAVQNALAVVYPPLTKGLAVAVILGLAIKLAWHRKRGRALFMDRDLALVSGLCACFLAARMALLCVVHVAAWHVDVRYVAPLFPIFLFLLAVLASALFPKGSCANESAHSTQEAFSHERH